MPTRIDKKRKQITSIKNERGVITIKPRNMTGIRKQHVQLHTKIWDNFREMDQFLTNTIKLTQNENKI